MKTKITKASPGSLYPTEFLEFLYWQKTYNLNQNELDLQHKELFDIAFRFYKSIKMPYNHNKVWSIFTEFLTKTRMHFEFEENLMEQFSYPYYQLHRMVHKDMIYQTTVLKTKIVKLKFQPKINDMKLLHRWLIQHILSDDKKMADFLSQLPSGSITFHSL